MKKIAGVILLLPLLGWLGTRAWLAEDFDRNCGGHIKNAATASSTLLASIELEKALEYIEKRGMKTGYTSVLWHTPDRSVAFWYSNIAEASIELKTQSNATVFEQDLTLLMVRGSLLHQGRETEGVRAPDGISIYPFNLQMNALLIVGIVLAIVGLFLVCDKDN